MNVPLIPVPLPEQFEWPEQPEQCLITPGFLIRNTVMLLCGVRLSMQCISMEQVRLGSSSLVLQPGDTTASSRHFSTSGPVLVLYSDSVV